MKNTLRNKRKGAAAFEWVLLSPLMVATFTLIFYFMFMALAYIQYGNLANVIAQDMNMRQSGITESQTSNPNITFGSGSESVVAKGDLTIDERLRQFVNGTDKQRSETVMKIETNSSDKFKNAVNYSVKRNGNRFKMPGVVVEKVKVDAFRNDRPATNFENIRMSGTIIKSEIKYKAFGLPFTVKGYNIIT